MEISENLLELAFRVVVMGACEESDARETFTKIMNACDKHGISFKKFLDVMLEAFGQGGSNDNT